LCVVLHRKCPGLYLAHPGFYFLILPSPLSLPGLRSGELMRYFNVRCVIRVPLRPSTPRNGPTYSLPSAKYGVPLSTRNPYALALVLCSFRGAYRRSDDLLFSFCRLIGYNPKEAQSCISSSRLRLTFCKMSRGPPFDVSQPPWTSFIRRFLSTIFTFMVIPPLAPTPRLLCDRFIGLHRPLDFNYNLF